MTETPNDTDPFDSTRSTDRTDSTTQNRPNEDRLDEDRPDEHRGSFEEREDGDGVWYTLPEMTRRDVAKWLGGIGGAAAVSSIAVGAVTGLSDAGLVTGDDEDQIYVEGTYLVHPAGNRVKLDALPRGEGRMINVLPEKKPGVPVKRKEATTALLRYTEGAYSEPTRLDWTAQGYVAYSAVCTHLGCLVAGRAEENLYCPCHASKYDPLNGAKVVGGPAPRALPQLPIGVSENNEVLIALGPFEAPVGPQ